MKQEDKSLLQELSRAASLKQKAQREKKTLLAQTIYLGTIGVMLSGPIILGAYVGSWLDDRLTGYSVNWTLSFILIGVFVGSVSVYLLIRENA